VVSGSESDRQTMGTEGATKHKHLLSRTLSIQGADGGECMPRTGSSRDEGLEMKDYCLLTH